MIQKNPFNGLTFLLTRDPDSNKKLARVLTGMSAHVIDWPGFKYVEKRTTPLLKDCLNHIADFDWIIFTSTRAVFYFLKKYHAVHCGLKPLARVKVAAVGIKTAELAKEQGMAVHLCPQRPSIKSLVEESAFKNSKNKRIFIPRSEDARDDFVRAYQKIHEIHHFVFYKKRFIKQDSHDVIRLKQTGVDWVLFFSPSAVASFTNNFCRQHEAVVFLQRTKVAVIGKTTASHLDSLGVAPCVVSKKSTGDDLIKGILKHVLSKHI
ncbi:MAG: uroporphyrinogen-III synthase [Deltaproteobacteria bacterium]|nr:uroporphyrinogen-III synthase [Deltaproteobacteria bacterium]